MSAAADIPTLHPSLLAVMVAPSAVAAPAAIGADLTLLAAAMVEVATEASPFSAGPHGMVTQTRADAFPSSEGCAAKIGCRNPSVSLPSISAGGHAALRNSCLLASSFTLAAMMKSFSCRPLILWVWNTTRQ